MIHLDGVTVRFETDGADAVTALESIDLEVERGETLCLIGGSGSGKTTCLRLINRLQEPTVGRVMVRGEDVAQLDPIRLRRSMGYVIQAGGLFPHLDVQDNIGLLCELEGWTAERKRARTDELLDLVRLPAADYANRLPSELSGGERQRVGVARALALDPPIVLMDEPFGALDPITRDHLQTEFIAWKSAVAKTIVMVSHDLREAFRLADRVALLQDGHLAQVGTTADFRERPANAHVEEFMARLSRA
jgi:osmoprotectant transport system ATP-binding protein